MRVSVVHSFYSSAQPSGENVVVELQVEALRRAGHEVQLVSRSTDDLGQERAYAVRAGLRVATGRGGSPAEELRAFQPDVVHVHNLFPNFGHHWLKDWDTPVVATLHNFRPLCAAGTLHRDGSQCELCPTHGSSNAVRYGCYHDSRVASLPLAIATRNAGSHHAVLRRADRLVTLSDRAAHAYSRLAPSLMSRVVVVPNFVDGGSLSAKRGDGPWLFAGRLTQEKGIAELVRQWPAHVPLEIVGDGPERAALIEDSMGKEIAILGPMPRDIVAQKLERAAGLAFPSLWSEGIATVYLEALATATPVLAWPDSAVADDVYAGGTGVVVDPADTARAVDQISASSEQFAEAALARFEARFTEAAWLASMTRLYAEVTA